MSTGKIITKQINKMENLKRFRISKNDEIRVDVRRNGVMIIKTIYDTFTSISSVKCSVYDHLPWDLKGAGKLIEIAIHNRTKNQSKFINVLS